MNCPRCNTHPAIEDTTYGILPCEQCQSNDYNKSITSSPEFINLSKKDRIDPQREKHERDMIPPFLGKDNNPNPEFVREYPQLARQYFDKKQLERTAV